MAGAQEAGPARGRGWRRRARCNAKVDHGDTTDVAGGVQVNHQVVAPAQQPMYSGRSHVLAMQIDRFFSVTRSAACSAAGSRLLAVHDRLCSTGESTELQQTGSRARGALDIVVDYLTCVDVSQGVRDRVQNSRYVQHGEGHQGSPSGDPVHQHATCWTFATDVSAQETHDASAKPPRVCHVIREQCDAHPLPAAQHRQLLAQAVQPASA